MAYLRLILIVGLMSPGLAAKSLSIDSCIMDKMNHACCHSMNTVMEESACNCGEIPLPETKGVFASQSGELKYEVVQQSDFLDRIPQQITLFHSTKIVLPYLQSPSPSPPPLRAPPLC